MQVNLTISLSKRDIIECSEPTLLSGLRASMFWRPGPEGQVFMLQPQVYLVSKDRIEYVEFNAKVVD